MKLSILAIFILILSACGRSPTGRAPSSLLGTQQSAVQSIAGSQKNLALNMCFDLKNKNILWRTSLVGSTTLVFDIEESKCDEQALPVKTVSTSLKGPINSQAMYFDPQPGQTIPFGKVETDVEGILSPICTDLIQGNDVSNTLSNSDGSKVQVSFQQNSINGFDGFTATYFKPQETTAWKEVVVEIAIDTAGLPSSDLKGLEKVIRSSSICPSGDIATIKQSYIP